MPTGCITINMHLMNRRIKTIIKYDLWRRNTNKCTGIAKKKYCVIDSLCIRVTFFSMLHRRSILHKQNTFGVGIDSQEPARWTKLDPFMKFVSPFLAHLRYCHHFASVVGVGVGVVKCKLFRFWSPKTAWSIKIKLGGKVHWTVL